MLKGWIRYLAVSVGGLAMFIAQNSPDGVRSNVSSWYEYALALQAPPWLMSPAVDDWVFRAGLALITLIFVSILWRWLRRERVSNSNEELPNESEAAQKLEIVYDKTSDFFQQNVTVDHSLNGFVENIYYIGVRNLLDDTTIYNVSVSFTGADNNICPFPQRLKTDDGAIEFSLNPHEMRRLPIAKQIMDSASGARDVMLLSGDNAVARVHAGNKTVIRIGAFGKDTFVKSTITFTFDKDKELVLDPPISGLPEIGRIYGTFKLRKGTHETPDISNV